MKSLDLLIFGSGRGSNFQTIHKNIMKGSLSASISAAISDVINAPILQYCIENGVLSKYISRENISRSQHEGLILKYTKDISFDLVILAGYMRILSGRFISEIGKPIINIHPSLLPSFPGLNAQRQALEYGVKFTGCTVHVVNEVVDGGKILGQATVAISENDTVDTLSSRIIKEEHKLFSRIINQIALSEIII